MSPDCFLDSNILVYAAIGQASWPERHARAREVIADNDFAISAQVLQEFFVSVTRKSREPLSSERARAWLFELRDRPCVPIDWELVIQGVDIADRYKISYWDGAIVAAAQRSDAAVLYTEDLNHGQLYGSVRAVNPFQV